MVGAPEPEGCGGVENGFLRPYLLTFPLEMDNPPNVWLCPATLENLRKSILAQHNGSYIWAFNEERKKSWDSLRIGDICVFGNLNSTQNIGYKYLCYVTGKRILEGVDDQWPFRSPSGTLWRYAFTLSPPVDIDIHRTAFAQLRPRGPVQTQTMLKGEEAIRFRTFVNDFMDRQLRLVP